MIGGKLQKENRSSHFAACIASKAQALTTKSAVVTLTRRINFARLIFPVYGLCSLV